MVAYQLGELEELIGLRAGLRASTSSKVGARIFIRELVLIGIRESTGQNVVRLRDIRSFR